MSEYATVSAKQARRWNWFLIVFFVGGFAYTGFILPSLLLRSSGFLWSLLPFLLVNNVLWALLHEAVHGHIVAGRERSYRIGRVLGVCFGSPFVALRLGHSLHHRFNRSQNDRTELRVLRSSGGLAEVKVRASYFFDLIGGGVFFMEVLAPMLSFLPRGFLRTRMIERLKPASIERALAEHLLKERNFREMRVDALVVLVLWSLSAHLYFTASHLGVFCAIVGFRAFAISYVDNVYHYGAAPGVERWQGYNLQLPAWLSKLALASNYHGVHHVHPGLGWWQLPERFQLDGRRFDYGFAQAAVRQLRGPIFVNEREWEREHQRQVP